MSELNEAGNWEIKHVLWGENAIFSRYRNQWMVIAGLMIAGLVKISLVLSNVVPFNADEAVVALMARHILHGERPIFFYGQAYMGSLDAWLVALAFSIFGSQVWVIRAVQCVIFLCYLGTTYWLGKLIYTDKRVGMIALWLLVIPTINLTLYTTASLGGYGEALLIGNLMMITAINIVSENDESRQIRDWKWMLLGFLAGCGLWAFGLTLVYTLPVGLFVAWRLWNGQKYVSKAGAERKISYLRIGLLILLGTIIGSFPWLLYISQNGLNAPFAELAGSAIAGVEGVSGLAQVGQHLINFVLLGTSVIIGIRPPWSIDWLVLPLIPFIIAFWVFVISHVINQLRKGRRESDRMILLVGVILTNILGFILTPFGADPSGRYFLPMAAPLSIFAAYLILSWRLRFGVISYFVVLLLLVYNFLGTMHLALKNPPGITTQFNSVTQIDHRRLPELLAFLKEKGETRGYTNYWVSYPLAFYSQEDVIFIPDLPYHQDFRYTTRDYRYKSYRENVTNSEKIAFITTHHTSLDQYLRDQFKHHGIKWQEQRIGDYQVFYSLSEPIEAEEIGLGSSTSQ